MQHLSIKFHSLPSIVFVDDGRISVAAARRLIIWWHFSHFYGHWLYDSPPFQRRMVNADGRRWIAALMEPQLVSRRSPPSKSPHHRVSQARHLWDATSLRKVLSPHAVVMQSSRYVWCQRSAKAAITSLENIINSSWRAQCPTLMIISTLGIWETGAAWRNSRAENGQLFRAVDSEILPDYHDMLFITSRSFIFGFYKLHIRLTHYHGTIVYAHYRYLIDFADAQHASSLVTYTIFTYFRLYVKLRFRASSRMLPSHGHRRRFRASAKSCRR